MHILHFSSSTDCDVTGSYELVSNKNENIETDETAVS